MATSKANLSEATASGHGITPRRFRLRMGPVCIAFYSGGWNRCRLEGDSMTSLDAVRARFARNEGFRSRIF